MNDAMLNHGLDKPEVRLVEGEVAVTLPGQGDNIDRIRIPADAPGLITPVVEARLNDRQRKMATMLVQGEKLTSRQCEQKFGVSRDTTSKDFKLLMDVSIAESHGQGRSRYYVHKGSN